MTITISICNAHAPIFVHSIYHIYDTTDFITTVIYSSVAWYGDTYVTMNDFDSN